MKSFFNLIFIFNIIISLNAQIINLNENSILESIRDHQLLGNINSNISFTSQPISFENFNSDELKKLQLDKYSPSVFKFNDGKSPFLFDQIVDTKVIEIGLKQRIYKPIAIKVSGEINLEDNISNDEKLINPKIELSWNRRAYNVSLNYNFDTEVGGINFNIFSFNFDGLGEKF